MNRSPAFWHERYQHQARWTRALRAQAYQTAALREAQRVLEVGSGTGVILSDLAVYPALRRHGVDIDPAATRFAHERDASACLSLGDGARLPFADSVFDATLCHFLLLWVGSPQQVVLEMCRVTRPGGWVLCLAEPDYGGRIDHPPPLDELGRLQTRALRDQGTNPQAGRLLPGLLADAGLGNIRSGVLGADAVDDTPHEADPTEWVTLRADLAGTLSQETFDHYERQDRQAWADGSRVLFVPTFFAFGKKPTPKD
jgi:SAM-dependent methyltransferase